jgi:hypothetical protein
MFWFSTEYFQSDDHSIEAMLSSIERLLRDLHDSLLLRGFTDLVCNVICVSTHDRLLGMAASVNVFPYPDKEVVFSIDIRRVNDQSVSVVAELDYDNGHISMILNEACPSLTTVGVFTQEEQSRLLEVMSTGLRVQLENIEYRLHELQQLLPPKP